MIELKENSTNDSFDIYIDGKICVGAYANGKKYPFYYSKSNDTNNELMLQCLEDFIPFESIWLENVFSWINFESVLWLRSHHYFGEKRGKYISVMFLFEPDLLAWDKNYSFRTYAKKFEDVFQAEGGLGKYEYHEKEAPQFSITFSVPKSKSSIKNYILPYENSLKIINNKVSEELSNISGTKFLLASFNFPETLKVSCEQYLQYFARFLQDLGINATSNLKEEAGKVLFSVTPTDDVEALDKIREALALYLNLPSSPIVYDESFASMRLQAEIERLQSSQRIAEMEFRVAHKALESQDKIILQQSTLLEQQAKVIEKITDKAVMINSAENKEELVKIYEGAEFSHSKWLFELTGIKLNPVKVIETAVKNTLGKGDEIIELGLDKEVLEEK